MAVFAEFVHEHYEKEQTDLQLVSHLARKWFLFLFVTIPVSQRTVQNFQMVGQCRSCEIGQI